MNCRKLWGDKPYHSLDYEMKSRYGQKVYKVSLEGGLTCPNRDGTIGYGGCIFCSGSGSGDFAAPCQTTIKEQIDLAIQGISSRKHVGNKFIAYFQSFTNTYGPIDKLRSMYFQALAHDDILGLSIATRPDCLPEDVLDLLDECNKQKPTAVELGLQTIHPKTALFIRRGYPYETFLQAVNQLHTRGIEIIVHVIAGLPGETKEDFMATINALSALPISGIKLQLLHVLKGTDLAELMGSFHVLTEDEYVDWITSALIRLPQNIVIHRLTGDGPKDLLIAPLWSQKKRQVLNHIHKSMKEQDLWQGKLLEGNDANVK
jgi:radical SAM protein (TIGR01212 family)